MTEVAQRTGILTATNTGLELERGLPLERWQQIGADLARRGNRLAWQIADWLHYGEWEYGDRYIDAIAATGLDYGTLRNYASVAGKFSMSRRRDNLSFAHHAEVTGLPFTDQDAWLDLAEEHGWSRNELRDRIRASRALTTTTSQTGILPADLVVFRLTIPTDREQRWRHAADKAGADLQQWLIDVADQAAAQAA